MSELDEVHLQVLREQEGRLSEMQAAHETSVAALEEKVTESLELAEQIEADHDGNLDALRTRLSREHGAELDALRARLDEAVRAAEAKEAEAVELSEECDALSAELKRVGAEARAAAGDLAGRLGVAEEARAAVEEALSETVATVRFFFLSFCLFGCSLFLSMYTFCFVSCVVLGWCAGWAGWERASVCMARRRDKGMVFMEKGSVCIARRKRRRYEP